MHSFTTYDHWEHPSLLHCMFRKYWTLLYGWNHTVKALPLLKRSVVFTSNVSSRVSGIWVWSGIFQPVKYNFIWRCKIWRNRYNSIYQCNEVDTYKSISIKPPPPPPTAPWRWLSLYNLLLPEQSYLLWGLVRKSKPTASILTTSDKSFHRPCTAVELLPNWWWLWRLSHKRWLL